MYTLLETSLDYMLMKFEANRMVRNVQNVELFAKKTEFLKIIFAKTILLDLSVPETIV